MVGDAGSSDDVEYEVISQQARVADDTVHGALVVHAINVRSGRGLQLDISFKRSRAGTAPSAVQLTRLAMLRDGSNTVEELAVDEQRNPKSVAEDDVIDVQYEVHKRQQGNR